MSILNPSMNKMIAELVAMPPQQLAQYAAQNQNDTMKFLAAKAASDMQKKQMAAGAAQQQQQAAPPVAQQVVQQMSQGLPEETGIGALPAPNMRGYAAGGIVAFSDGGYTYDPYAEQDVYSPEGVLVSGPSLDVVGASDTTLMERMGILNRANRKAVEQIGRPKQVQSQIAPAVSSTPYTGTGAPSASAAALRSGASTQAGQTARADAAKAGTGAAGAPGAARTGISALGAPQQMATPDFVGSYADVLKQMPKSEAPKEFGEIEKLRVDQATEGLTSEQEAAAKMQEVLGKRDTRIGQREKRLADKSANDINMSLIDAGLAMMQSRGQGLAGIAEGFTAGAKRYTEESRLTEAARQKIEEARDAYDDLKFNREDMSRKEINARKKDITDAHVAVKQANVDYMVKHEDMDRRTADRVYDAKMGFALEGQKQQNQARENALNRDNALKAAGISAGAPTAAKIDMLERLGAADPNSPLYKGYMMTVQEGQEPMLYKAYTDRKSDMATGEAFTKQYPTFELYKAGMSGGGGNFVKPPAGATAPIYTR